MPHLFISSFVVEYSLFEKACALSSEVKIKLLFMYRYYLINCPRHQRIEGTNLDILPKSILTVAYDKPSQYFTEILVYIKNKP